MNNSPQNETSELKRLDDIATEKRLAYELIDIKIFSENNIENNALLPEYTKAKKELIEAVNELYI